MIYTFDMLPKGIVKNLNDFYNFCEFTDGSWSGNSDRAVKYNEQILDEVHYPSMLELIDNSVKYHKEFTYKFLPRGNTHPNFLRYREGMHYDWHNDNWIIDEMRTDYSITVFLSEPDEYEGGELEIRVGDSTTEYKLEAGKGVIYHTGLHHRVKPVTKGERRVITWWTASLVDDTPTRAIITDLSEILMNMDDHPMKGRLETVRANLIRENATI